MSHVSSPSAHGQPALRTVQVLGGGSAGSGGGDGGGAYVLSLAAGLVARGVRVTVCAPPEAERAYRFGAVGARHVPVPRRNDPASVAALRAACADADLVHAHGLHAALRAALALSGRRVPLVVTWHTRAYADGARAPLLRVLERRVARAASVVLGTSTDLVDRARARGARDARLAAVSFPPPRTPGPGPGPGPGPDSASDEADRARHKTRADLGALGRPLLMAVGSLERHRGYDVLLDAAHAWLGLDPVPLVVVVGEGPMRAALQRRIDGEGLPVRLAGRRDDVAELLRAADLAVLPSSWESRSTLAQEALHARVPLVATAVGGIPELVGDAAELVPYGDAVALSRAVERLLADSDHCERLRALGSAQAASWPTEDATVAQVLSVYDELTGAV
ncbi:glycosyltransferase family 4 protein [Streptomyces beihaiensis]|uniref:Glycosyltransferase family 4 protein n=1 Tax=Streptomyces beihaiensis TaxID=2984495 RepID=A0ABT3U6K6_9ACTN|nr:glycosyltransferase family 4 protein [Streptomyces beihaiensis]MCX3064306.1 glycosyltransferase family 4 protein [Streptomyces beihaiensis]